MSQNLITSMVRRDTYSHQLTSISDRYFLVFAQTNRHTDRRTVAT